MPRGPRTPSRANESVAPEKPLERGFALPAALLALVVIGVVVTGGFYAASQEDRSSQGVDGGQDAFYAAEQGIQQMLGQWTLRDFPQGARWSTTRLPRGTVTRHGQDIGTYVVTARKLDDLTYLITSTGRTRRDGRTAAVRRLGQVVRASPWKAPLRAALYVNGALTVEGNARISGDDVDSGACNGGDPVVAGVVSSDASRVRIEGAARVAGDPRVDEDPRMTATSLLRYGAEDFNSLAAAADLRFAAGPAAPGSPNPVVSGRACDSISPGNWGDPRPGNACSRYEPLVYINGDVSLSNGRGRGVLLVDGDLTVAGNFDYAGIVVARGSIRFTGEGNRIRGVVLSASSGTASGGSVLQYSSCSVQRAARSHVRMRPIASRSWFDFTAAGAY